MPFLTIRALQKTGLKAQIYLWLQDKVLKMIFNLMIFLSGASSVDSALNMMKEISQTIENGRFLFFLRTNFLAMFARTESYKTTFISRSTALWNEQYSLMFTSSYYVSKFKFKKNYRTD